MNFFQRVRAVFSKTYFDQYLEDWYQGNDVPNSFSKMSQEQALRYSAFFGCNRVLAETFASVTINEYKKLESGDRETTNDTGLLPVLRVAPNDETSRYNFQECQMYQINLGGNFVAERLMNGRRIAGLSQIEWQDYRIIRDQDDGRIKYELFGKKENITLERDEVLHIPGPSVNGVTGMSILEYAAASILLGNSYETFARQFYKNGAVPSGVFEIPKFLKDEAYNRLKLDLKKNYSGFMNAGTPMLLEDDLKFNPITIKPIDAELLNSKKFQVEDICRFFRVQPHLIQHLEKSTNNNIEMQSLEFVMYTMLPHFRRAEDNINFQLLTPRQRADGYYFEYNMATLLRGDQKSMSESFAKGIQWGWLSVNDVRRVLNLNSVPDGDTYLQPLNMVPLGTEPDDSGNVSNFVTKTVNKALEEAAKKGTV